MPPSIPDEDEGTDEGEDATMPSIHRVIEYSGLSYYDALELPCDVFALMFKHSIIDEYQKTEGGREYLEKCKRLQQTDIDVSAFRKMKAGNRKGGK